MYMIQRILIFKQFMLALAHACKKNTQIHFVYLGNEEV
jgi:hypothetical protein